MAWNAIEADTGLGVYDVVHYPQKYIQKNRSNEESLCSDESTNGERT